MSKIWLKSDMKQHSPNKLPMIKGECGVLKGYVWITLSSTILSGSKYNNPRWVCSEVATVILCSETSVYGCNIHSLIMNFAILFGNGIITLLQYSVFKSFAAEFQPVRGSIVPAVSFTTETQHFRNWITLWKDQDLVCYVFLWLSQQVRGESFQLHRQ